MKIEKIKIWNSITGKLVWILILLILPFNLIAIVTVGQSLWSARIQTEQSMESMSNLAMQQLDNRIEAMNEFFYSMVEDREDFHIFAAQGERDGAYYRAETKLARYLNSNAGNKALADGFFWYGKKYEETYASLTALEGKNEMEMLRQKEKIIEWMKENAGVGYGNWSIANIGGIKWVIKICAVDDFYYGALFSLENLAAEIERNSSFSETDVRFSKRQESIEVPEQTLYVNTVSQKSDLQMSMFVPRKDSYSRLSLLQILCLVLVGLYLLLIPVLVLAMHRIVLSPLKRIRNAMEHLESGEQSYRIPNQKSSEEFEVIDSTFNSMADRIQELKIENYEKELESQRMQLEKRKMELKNLQLQIRPHFLLNMFNLLYSFAQIENYQNIQKLALYLSDYFRHIFQSGKDLQPFEREFVLIQKYLEVSAMRYPNWYEVVYEVEPEALEVPVPPLLIHNFIENIFKHVINYDQKVHIRLEAYTSEDEAVFIIADDGPGMDPEMADNINNGVFPEENQGRVHVGIANSYRRIRYFYGERGKLTVESELGEGTCFTIVLPKEEEM